MLRFLFHWSRCLHRYTGLLFLVYFLWMGVTGVLLNHPALLDGLSVPTSLLPGSHNLEKGRRLGLQDAVWIGDRVVIAGRGGVWQSRDGGRSFTPMAEGFPTSVFQRETRSLLYDAHYQRIFAGTRGGFYLFQNKTGFWSPVEDSRLSSTPIVDLVRTDNRLLVFTEQQVFSADLRDQALRFSEEPLVFEAVNDSGTVSLSHFLLKIHDGTILGMPGRLFVDLLGLCLIFLGLSGCLFWGLSGRRLSTGGSQRIKWRKWCYRHHLKIGVLTGLFLVVITLTGVLIRPPFSTLIRQQTVPAWMLPLNLIDRQNPHIDQASYHPESRMIWLATRDGFYQGRIDFSGPFRKRTLPIPTSGMGTRALVSLPEGGLLVGSFRGLHRWSETTGKASMVQVDPPSGGRADRLLVTSILVKEGEPSIVVDYRRGMQPLAGHSSLVLPQAFERPQMSLWHFLFELHNGRLFQQWLGPYTWLLVPCGGFLLLLNLICGLWAWLIVRQKVRLPRKTG